MSAAFWDRIAERYAARPVSDTASYEATLERVRHWLRPEMQVLELGCGTGSTAERLAGDVSQFTASDFSAEMIRIAESRCEAANLRFLCAGVGDALGGGPYDAVMAFNLLHLLDDLEGCLSQIHATLGEGGLFLSKTPCVAGKWYLWPAVRVLQALGKVPPVRFLRPAQLETAIREAGFDILETGGYPAKLPNHFVVARKQPAT